jgi:hypothetical protein
MTYRAAKLSPTVPSVSCFPKDVPLSSWFAAYVCDAQARGFVKGYDDGTFKPANMVSLAEAVKISFNVLNISVPNVSADDVTILPYAISPFAWYAPYIVAATQLKILPLPDQGNEFRLNDPIERQEAAVLLYRVWNIWRDATNSSSSSSAVSSVSSTSSVASASSSSAGSRASGGSSSSQKPKADVRTMPMSGSDSWQMTVREKMLYKFSLNAKTVMDIDVMLKTMVNAHVTCRLYKIEEDGLAPEYYWGVEEGKACGMRVALAPGRYQLELQANVDNAPYTLTVTPVAGDGSDGLVEASPLQENLARTSALTAHDSEDWYKFKVTDALEGIGASYQLDVTTNDKVDCVINPWTDAIVFGEIPACNTKVLLSNGTYYVRVRHPTPLAGKAVYTIVLRKF